MEIRQQLSTLVLASALTLSGCASTSSQVAGDIFEGTATSVQDQRQNADRHQHERHTDGDVALANGIVNAILQGVIRFFSS